MANQWSNVPAHGALAEMMARDREREGEVFDARGQWAVPQPLPKQQPAPKPLRIPAPDWHEEERERLARERAEQAARMPVDEPEESLAPRPASRKRRLLR